jgi:alkanesulfonate monooxygenase SsuD/methylene tetrahydromethanopterin reductase-like flavin-dependent oxidoreductase (luciferase family)
MVGSTGERILHAALPHVDAWNTWYTEFGNQPERFAELNARIDELVEETGRGRATVERSACTLVVLDRAAGERTVDEGVVPLEGSPDDIAGGLRAFAEAGADEAILVLIPITERTIRDLGEVLSLLSA